MGQAPKQCPKSSEIGVPLMRGANEVWGSRLNRQTITTGESVRNASHTMHHKKERVINRRERERERETKASANFGIWRHNCCMRHFPTLAFARCNSTRLDTTRCNPPFSPTPPPLLPGVIAKISCKADVLRMDALVQTGADAMCRTRFLEQPHPFQQSLTLQSTMGHGNFCL